MRACQDPNYVGSVPVLQSVKNFIATGKLARFDSLRGNSTVQCFLTYDSTGQYSYLAGRPQRFAQNFEIDNNGIKAIEITGATRAVINPTSPAATDPMQSKFVEGYLVIMDNCNNEIARIPLTLLNRTQNGGKLYFCNFQNIRWSACFVVFPAAAGISAANSICFNVTLNNK